MGWFNGLSEKFLTMPNGRLLILAGTERLDKALTIGQMQGTYCSLSHRKISDAHFS
jgi:protein phosphatase methylesterase 1